MPSLARLAQGYHASAHSMCIGLVRFMYALCDRLLAPSCQNGECPQSIWTVLRQKRFRWAPSNWFAMVISSWRKPKQFERTYIAAWSYKSFNSLSFLLIRSRNIYIYIYIYKNINFNLLFAIRYVCKVSVHYRFTLLRK